METSLTDDDVLLRLIGESRALPLQIDQLAGPDLPVFVRDYMSLERPALVRAQHLQGVRRLQARWRSANLLKAPRGEQRVTAASIPYGDAFSEQGVAVELAQFVAALAVRPLRAGKQPLYVFESLHPNCSLAEDARLVEHLLFPEGHIAATSRQFFLGEAGSGAPFHFHRAAFNVLAHGRKLWWLIPPKDAVYSTTPMLSYLAQGFEMPPSTIQFVQEPGDIVLVPDFWAHATVNLETSIGVAVEYVWGSSEFSLDSTKHSTQPQKTKD